MDVMIRWLDKIRSRSGAAFRRHRDGAERRPSARVQALFLLAILALTGCADEPIPRGPVETGPMLGDAIQIFSVEESIISEADQTTEEAAPADETLGEGVVAGRIIMGSPSSSVAPVGVEVTLQGATLNVDMGTLSTFLTLTTTTDAEGEFRFEGAPMDQPHLFYEVGVVHDGVTFSEWALADPQNPSLFIPLTIYERTDNPDFITVDAMHIVIGRYRDALVVFQLYVFSNGSDRIFVDSSTVGDGQNVGVSVSLPPNAFDVVLDEDELGSRFVSVGNTVYDTEYAPPGQRSHTISFSYLLPADVRIVTLPITHTTARVNVLAEPGIRVRSSSLAAAGTQAIEDDRFDAYTGRDLTAGDTLTLRLRIPGEGSNTTLIALGVGVAFAAAFGGIYLAVRNRRSVAGMSAQQETLIRQIADLDEAFEAGRINRFDYEARRADLKATLAEEFQND